MNKKPLKVKYANNGEEEIETRLVKGRTKADIFSKKQKGGGFNKSWLNESPPKLPKKIVKKKLSFRKWL